MKTNDILKKASALIIFIEIAIFPLRSNADNSTEEEYNLRIDQDTFPIDSIPIIIEKVKNGDRNGMKTLARHRRGEERIFRIKNAG